MSFVPKGRAASAVTIVTAFASALLVAVIAPASAAPPANDDIANAFVLVGPSGSVAGDNAEATVEAGEEQEFPGDEEEEADRTLWYTWLPAHSGPVTFRTETAGEDPNLFIAVGQTINGRFIAVDDDDTHANNVDALVTIQAEAGRRLSIAVGSHSGSAFTFTLHWSQVVPAGATITGTGRKDVLNGTPGDDVIYGKGGNDIIDGGGGNDLILGGGGKDVIEGGPGVDTLQGNGGRDKFVTQDGFVDTISGGGGRDRFVSRDANDAATSVKG